MSRSAKKQIPIPLILGGYLRGKYAVSKPFALSASIAFEQSYSGVDGDSASSTEVYAILSSLSGLPLRQDIAVTGSLNQKGEIQREGDGPLSGRSGASAPR